MGTRDELNSFLASVEKRGYSMALSSVGNADDALDIVQDVMLRLARRYRSRHHEEWPPLFYRMLNNRINDYHRARKVRRRFFGWLEGRNEEQIDPLAAAPGPDSEEPDQRLDQRHTAQQLMQAINGLPDRQRQAFTLRAWQGMDVASTASAMGCSAGSVKTHYSRAISALRAKLKGDDYA